MTVQKSKNPQIDAAENDAFFPSEYSLSQYTSPVSDLEGPITRPLYRAAEDSGYRR